MASATNSTWMSIPWRACGYWPKMNHNQGSNLEHKGSGYVLYIYIHNYISNKYCNCLVSHSTIRNSGFCNPMYCTNSNHVRVWWEIHLLFTAGVNLTASNMFLHIHTQKKNDAVQTWRLTPKSWPSKNGENESWGFEHMFNSKYVIWLWINTY